MVANGSDFKKSAGQEFQLFVAGLRIVARDLYQWNYVVGVETFLPELICVAILSLIVSVIENRDSPNPTMKLTSYIGG